MRQRDCKWWLLKDQCGSFYVDYILINTVWGWKWKPAVYIKLYVIVYPLRIQVDILLLYWFKSLQLVRPGQGGGFICIYAPCQRSCFSSSIYRDVPSFIPKIFSYIILLPLPAYNPLVSTLRLFFSFFLTCVKYSSSLKRRSLLLRSEEWWPLLLSLCASKWKIWLCWNLCFYLKLPLTEYWKLHFSYLKLKQKLWFKGET